MKNVFKLLALESILLVLMFACGAPPEKESGNKTSNIEPQQEILKKKVEHEAKKVAKILQKTGEKLQNIPKKIYEERSSENGTFSRNGGDKPEADNDKDYSKIPDIAKFQKEVINSVREDPLYQALSILERINTRKTRK